MNICFLSREYPPQINGGVGIYIYEMAKAFIGLGHTVYVITEAFNEEGEFNEEGIYVYRIKPVELPALYFLKSILPRTIERLEYSFAVSKKLKEIALKKQIDIVESTDARAEGLWYYLFNNTPALLIKLHTPESIIFKWNNEPSSIDHSILKIIEEFWLFKAKVLLTISSEMPDILSRYYKIIFSKIIQQPNPIDVNLFKPDWGKKNNDSITILYTGRLEFRKGVHVLIRTVPEILKEFPSAKFIFIGKDCGMKSYLTNKIREFNCEDNISFIEYIPRNELPIYYQKSSLCIIPSLWENFPYTCLEAMACGKPVVASCVGGITEIIQSGINGSLVQPGSVKDLTQAIIRILRDKTFGEKMGIAAADSIKANYERFNIAKETLRIYQNIYK